MKAVIQRVMKGKVVVDGRTVGKIGKGFLVFLGVKKGDRDTDVEYIGRKVVNLRVFEDEVGKMNLRLKDVEGEILLVSQFTLHGDTKGQNRPSFIEAAEPKVAEKMYNEVGKVINKEGVKVEKGVFGAKMEVEIVNDGPVTIIIESKNG